MCLALHFLFIQSPTRELLRLSGECTFPFSFHFADIMASHDYISDLHSKSHGNKFKTFKEWNAQGYSRIVQDMIGYANYVDKQRREECVMDPEALPEVINFEKGPGGLLLLPLEVKGLRGLETAKHAREIIRAFFLRHYRRFHIRSRLTV